jgi:hypothetical protein
LPKDNPYKEFIVPIYNNANLDKVLIEVGYDIDEGNKAKSYQKIFPVDVGNIEAFNVLYQRIKILEKKHQKQNLNRAYHITNLSLFLEECKKQLENTEKYKRN